MSRLDGQGCIVRNQGNQNSETAKRQSRGHGTIRKVRTMLSRVGSHAAGALKHGKAHVFAGLTLLFDMASRMRSLNAV
jgi:hypothetical protein